MDFKLLYPNKHHEKVIKGEYKNYLSYKPNIQHDIFWGKCLVLLHRIKHCCWIKRGECQGIGEKRPFSWDWSVDIDKKRFFVFVTSIPGYFTKEDVEGMFKLIHTGKMTNKDCPLGFSTIVSEIDEKDNKKQSNKFDEFKVEFFLE